MIRFSPNDAYQSKSFYEIFDPKFWEANYRDGAFFKDKIVLIGAASQIAHDVVATPMTPDMPGPVLHLQTMAAAMRAGIPAHDAGRVWITVFSALAGIFSWAWLLSSGGHSSAL